MPRKGSAVPSKSCHMSFTLALGKLPIELNKWLDVWLSCTDINFFDGMFKNMEQHHKMYLKAKYFGTLVL